jgi:hypothetical protein
MKNPRITWALAALALAQVGLGLAPARAQEYGGPPEAPSGKFSETEQHILKNIDDAIARFDALLKTVTDIHEKHEVKSFLDSLKDRRFQLKPGFDTSVSDNLRLDIEIEYQRLVAWLAPMTPTRANRRDIRIPLPPVMGAVGGSGSSAPITHATKANDGWVSLFDGKSLAGWRGYGRQGLPNLPYGWEAKDGVLHARPADKTKNLKFDDFRKGELITEKKYTDYELSWEWKVAPKANSGIKYNVTEARPNAPGFEFQMTDDLANPNHNDPKRDRIHETAGLYFIVPPALDTPYKPAGEWNSSRLIVKGNHLEHWHNGKKVMSAELGSPEVKAGIAKSKFKDEPGFGDKIAGHIMLTFHGDEAWIRNIKIRELN